MNVGLKIQTLRKQRGMSQEQLAEVLGVSRQAVSKWEMDQSVPDLDKIIALCDCFGVTSDYLLRDNSVPYFYEEPKTDYVQKFASEPTADNTDDSKNQISAILLACAIILYILCVVPVIALSSIGFEIVGVCLMFLMVAVATGLIIYRYVRFGKKSKTEKKKDPVLSSVTGCLWAVTVVVYLVISFKTRDWHITWLIFPIAGAVDNIIEAIFDLKGGDVQ